MAKNSDYLFKAAVIAALMVVILVIVLYAPAIWHWILTVTGDQSAGTRWNLAWSGFLSAGVISGSIFTHTWHRMREANCHNHGCWRIGTHTTPDGYKLCKVCVAKPKSALQLHEVHEDHQ